MTEEQDREVPVEDFVTDERIAQTAYYKWLQRGCPPNDALTDWVEAHKELVQAAGKGFYGR